MHTKPQTLNTQTPVEHEDIGLLHGLLRGSPMTPVEVTLRREAHDLYSITVLRHAWPSRYHGLVNIEHAKAMECHVGLDITDDRPHRVSAIRDLKDIYGVAQGSPGYNNR